jgi:predicted RNase H-like nuclease
MNVIGIDLAWQSAKNTSAAAVGQLKGSELTVHELREGLDSVDAITALIAAQPEVEGVSIDALLIINNVTGQRSCEEELGRAYGARKASCHASNLSLYPDPSSVQLASALTGRGFEHLGQPGKVRWQIECYPHPAIIEIFGLPERHQYKKGSVDVKDR